jgi:hypothetical protein
MRKFSQPERRRNMLQDNSENKQQPSKASENELIALDYSLLTLTEMKIFNRDCAAFEKVYRKRMLELGLYPNLIFEGQESVVGSCMNSVELKSAFEIEAICEKNLRLRKKLSDPEKLIVRMYVSLTYDFAGLDSPVADSTTCLVKWFGDEAVGVFVKTYFSIMRKHNESVYEKPFYFLSSTRKKRVEKAFNQGVQRETTKRKQLKALEEVK